MTSKSPHDDPWTFSIFGPSTTSNTKDDADEPTAVRQLYQLPRASSAADDVATSNIRISSKAAVTSTPSTLSSSSNAAAAVVNNDPLQQEEIEITTAAVSDERTCLLHGNEQQAEGEGSPFHNNHPTSTGWTFSSPFWTMSSSILLKMTYKPAWQVLPEYTRSKCVNNNNNNNHGGSSSFLTTMASLAAACCCSCACCGACCDGTQADPYRSITFTSFDIDHVEKLDNLHIRGIGECTGLRLYLTYPEDCFRLTVPANVPQPYQEGWNSHLERAKQKQNKKSTHQQDDENNILLNTMKREIDQDTRAADTLPPPKGTNNIDGGTIKGPIMTFAMPKDSSLLTEGPPILWKVEIPPPMHAGPIAVESLTIMDGPLIAAVPQQQQPQSRHHSSSSNKPTHVFINGYQSWSFTGSVPIGQKQPQSAMADVWSKAFNHGATLPPVSLEYVGHDTDTRRVIINHKEKPLDATYRSDFFTCITSHEQELQEEDEEEIVIDVKHTTNDNNQANTRRRPRRRKIIHRPLDERGGPALVLGWLSQRRQFGIIAVDKDLQRIQMHASHQGQLLLPNDDGTGNMTTTMQTDWAFAQLQAPNSYDEEPLVHFLRAVAGYNQAKPLQNGPLLTGWCSWYHYYQNIDEQSLRTNFTQLSALRKTCPTNVSVVDDGYMTAWGDWNSLKPGKFSSTDSMKSVADGIRDEQMRPGIWLAPFACDKHSQLAQQHPDWIIRNHQGIPANSSNCGKFFYGLDATNPQVLQYVYDCIRRAVVDWGYRVLKIDFLYAACLDGNGKYDLSMSRAEAMHLALHTIRSAAGPDTFLIGCGCPLGSGVGYVDGMRISADTGPTWYPSFPLPWWDHGTLPSLRGMIRNSITRAPLGHRWWHNDPDCLMLGSTTHLTLEEVASSASIVALTCGMLLLSDDLTKVSPARMRILTKIFPMTGVTAVVLDLHSLKDSHGLPTMLRLWCTDSTEKREEFRRTKSGESNDSNRDHNEEAGYFSQFASFRLSEMPKDPNERQRSCIHVVKGLGTWTILAVSNWLDSSAVVHIPPMALAAPPEASVSTPSRRAPVKADHGYHIFAFWSSKYQWIAGTPSHPDAYTSHASTSDVNAANSFEQPMLSKLLGPHETVSSGRCYGAMLLFLCLNIYVCSLLLQLPGNFPHQTRRPAQSTVPGFRPPFFMWARSECLPCTGEPVDHSTSNGLSSSRPHFCVHPYRQHKPGENYLLWRALPLDYCREHSPYWG
jgi:Melibiase